MRILSNILPVAATIFVFYTVWLSKNQSISYTDYVNHKTEAESHGFRPGISGNFHHDLSGLEELENRQKLTREELVEVRREETKQESIAFKNKTWERGSLLFNDRLAYIVSNHTPKTITEKMKIFLNDIDASRSKRYNRVMEIRENYKKARDHYETRWVRNNGDRVIKEFNEPFMVEPNRNEKIEKFEADILWAANYINNPPSKDSPEWVGERASYKMKYTLRNNKIRLKKYLETIKIWEEFFINQSCENKTKPCVSTIETITKIEGIDLKSTTIKTNLAQT